MVASWRSRPERARSRRPSGGHSITVTAVAGSRAAGSGSGRAITSGTGPKGAPPRSRISPYSVAGTTARFTKRATRSIDSRTASFGSAARTGGRCPRSRLLWRCSAIPSRSYEDSTMPRDLSCTRGPPRRVGWGSAWTWAGRSTSCTPWRARCGPPEGLDRPPRVGPVEDRLVDAPRRHAVAHRVELRHAPLERAIERIGRAASHREHDGIDGRDPALGACVHVGDDYRRALDGAQLGVRGQDRPLREEARVEGCDGGDANVLPDVEERRDDLDPLALIQEVLGGRERLLRMDVVHDDDVGADLGAVGQHVAVRYDVLAVSARDRRYIGMGPGGDDARP